MLPPPPSPSIPLDKLVEVLSSTVPWRILRELANGDQLMVVELAEHIRQSPDLTSEHMAILRAAGVVTQGRNRFHQISPQFLADKTERLVDFGCCLLRMNAIA